ncbi:hypothetical protein B0H10DRAFT_1940947 [Mycena sp. CBHHK59/15]|nr:hypothetical protein B0H10DRAFT_1940947 [Mycena sp. CBHHK59/15]
MALSAVVLLVYDHLLTFGDEIEYIWKQKKSLNILVRQLWRRVSQGCSLPIGPKPCHNFARFEGAFTLVTVILAQAIIIVRIYAIYEKNKVILAGLLTAWVAIVLPDGPVAFGCVLNEDPRYLPTIFFDLVAFWLLVANFFYFSRGEGRSDSIFRIILRDGFLYFVVVVATNTTWTVVGALLTRDLQTMLTYITIILIGRMTINLRQYAASMIESSSELSGGTELYFAPDSLDFA